MTPTFRLLQAGQFSNWAKGAREHFDIIHLNDWMTGLVATYLKTVYRAIPAFDGRRPCSQFTTLAFPVCSARQLPKIRAADWLNRACLMAAF